MICEQLHGYAVHVSLEVHQSYESEKVEALRTQLYLLDPGTPEIFEVDG